MATDILDEFLTSISGSKKSETAHTHTHTNKAASLFLHMCTSEQYSVVPHISFTNRCTFGKTLI